MSFLEKLARTIEEKKSLLCIGLDPDPSLLPPGEDVLGFNRGIIDATAELACAYKPNIAFYEALGREGGEILKKTCEYVPGEIPIIIDAKRADIGNTAKAYARALFEYFHCDAITVNPYLGYDSLAPFFAYRDRGVFILCRTSNPGATDFQSLLCQQGNHQKMLFEIVAEKASEWNEYGNIGLVMGATFPEELKMIRQRYPEMPLLIPGIGAQGGELAAVVRFGVDARRRRTIINCSRQILYASRDNDYALAARKAAQEMKDRINQILSAQPS